MAKISELNLKIDGIHCASCVSSIERGVHSLDGVSECDVNLATRSARVLFDDSQLSNDEIIDTIEQLGFEAERGQSDIVSSAQSEEKESVKSFLISLAGTIPLMIVSMWPMVSSGFIHSPTVDGLAQAVLAGIVLFCFGRGILADAFLQLRHLRANMNTLIAMGTLAAYTWSSYGLIRTFLGQPEMFYFESAGMIITLVLLGRFLEARAKRRAGSAVEELLKLRPFTATAVINNVEVEIDPLTANQGMILLVRPGERVPADGKIIEGHATLNESMLTGESLPVERSLGGMVTGGSLNGNVPFKMEVTASAADSYLATIIKLVSEAQSKKAPVQALADRVASVFVPVVIGVALLTGVIWFLLAPDSPQLLQSVIAVLIIACPCALGLATPTAVLAGTGRGAKDGIIVKGGDILQMLSQIDTVVFDKTGTLTKGRLEVVSMRTFGQIAEQNMLRMVGSVESQSEHPIGRAIARHMKNRQISPAVVRYVQSRPGYGIVADCDGRRLLVGSRDLMEEEGIGFGPSLLQGEQEMERGRSVVFAALDSQVIGIISLADQVRGDARELIEALRKQGKSVTMLSGDSRKTASGVAQLLGIDDFEAEIKPLQKQLMIESYRRAGYKVAMVGDGVNDAPALVAADVGVAMGSGTDVALESADVVMVGSELDSVRKMFTLSQESMKAIRQNFFWAFFYNIIAIPVAAGLFYPLFGWTLSPIIAAAAMSLSSVFVVSNSLRLNRVEL